MLILLVCIGLMAAIAIAFYLYERRHGTSRVRRSDEPADQRDDLGAGENSSDDFDASGDADSGGEAD